MFRKAIAKPENDDKRDSSTTKSEKNKEARMLINFFFHFAQVTLLDSKVQQNVGIALVKYRMPSHEIKVSDML